MGVELGFLAALGDRAGDDGVGGHGEAPFGVFAMSAAF
jgi:hypothetical protein